MKGVERKAHAHQGKPYGEILPVAQGSQPVRLGLGWVPPVHDWQGASASPVLYMESPATSHLYVYNNTRQQSPYKTYHTGDK